MEAIAAGLGENPSDLRILAGSWDKLLYPDLAAEIEAYAEATGTALVCPGGDPHYCWTDGRPWEETHGNDPSSPRTMPQVLNVWSGFHTISFTYRHRQNDGTLQGRAPIYGIDVEQPAPGEWRVGELEFVGGFGTW